MSTADIERMLSRVALQGGPALADVDGLILAGRRRRAHGWLAKAGLVVVVLAVAVAGTAMTRDAPRDTVVAEGTQASYASPPSESALRSALSRTFPGMQVQESTMFPPDGMLDENESFYSGHGRIGGLMASAGQPKGLQLQINWQVLSPGLSDAEISRLLASMAEVDPQRSPPPSPTRVLNIAQDGLETRVLGREATLLAVSWSADGTVVVSTLGTFDPQQVLGAAQARQLASLARSLDGLPMPEDTEGDSAEQWLAILANRADRLAVVADPEGRTNAENGGRRTVGCITIAQSIRDAGRDWTQDTAFRDRADGTPAVRVDYLFASRTEPGRLDRSSVIFDWETGQLVSTFSSMGLPGTPDSSQGVEESGRTACPASHER